MLTSGTEDREDSPVGLFVFYHKALVSDFYVFFLISTPISNYSKLQCVPTLY